MDKLTQGEPGIPIRPPHPLQRQREGVPMNTRCTNTSTEENFHNSEINLKMEVMDHMRHSVPSTSLGTTWTIYNHLASEEPSEPYPLKIISDHLKTPGFTPVSRPL